MGETVDRVGAGAIVREQRARIRVIMTVEISIERGARCILRLASGKISHQLPGDPHQEVTT